MKKNYYDEELPFGSKELRLPRELRRPLLKHLQELKSKYLERNWGKAEGSGLTLQLRWVPYWIQLWKPRVVC